MIIGLPAPCPVGLSVRPGLLVISTLSIAATSPTFMYQSTSSTCLVCSSKERFTDDCDAGLGSVCWARRGTVKRMDINASNFRMPRGIVTACGGLMKKHRHAHDVRDFRTVLVRIVEARDIHALLRFAADLQRHGVVASVHDSDHPPGFSARHEVGGQTAEVVCDELVE